jgi:hypothetical protein
MNDCWICGQLGVVSVLDTSETASNIVYPTTNVARCGCEQHPPIGLAVSNTGAVTLVIPSGWTLGSGGVLTKNS